MISLNPSMQRKFANLLSNFQRRYYGGNLIVGRTPPYTVHKARWTDSPLPQREQSCNKTQWSTMVGSTMFYTLTTSMGR